MPASPEDLGAVVELLLEGILLSEASLRCSFFWAGSEYPCAGGPEYGGIRLDKGGFRSVAQLTLKVRRVLFPEGAGQPKPKQSIFYKRNASAEPKKYVIDSITDFYGAVLELKCEDPNQGA